MATVVKRGKASIEGVAGVFDVILYPVKQRIRLDQNFQEEVIQDERGFDAAWLARNEHIMNDIAMKILGDTAAHAKTGGAFLAPLAVVEIQSADLAVLGDQASGNPKWQYVGGASIDLENTRVGDYAIRLRRYTDSTQNTAAVTTPS